MTTPTLPEQSELGKKAAYEANYNPEKLFPIPRKLNRDKIGVSGQVPFFGHDIWNHYEVSWLDEQGKPIVAIAEIIYGCESENIIESKSMKLYLETFRNVGVFHEHLAVDIGEDFLTFIKPKKVEVIVRFNVRGGIAIEAVYRKERK